ncbi:hypothetical protein [Humidesulfovibrio sp.]
MNSIFDPNEWPYSLELPGKEDNFFAKEGNWQSNACVNWTHDKFTLYSMGYKEAADTLVKHIDETGRKQDILVYPILFLYRHYLELMLKTIINDARIIFEGKGGYPKDTHNLNDLWNTCYPLLNKLSPNDSVKEFAEIKRLFAEFTEFDPNSMPFRYPEDKKSCPSLPGLKIINLGNVKNVVGKISIILEGASSMVGESLSNMRAANQFSD